MNVFMFGRRHCLVCPTAVGRAHRRIIALDYDNAMSVPAVSSEGGKEAATGRRTAKWLVCDAKSAPAVRLASFWTGD